MIRNSSLMSANGNISMKVCGIPLERRSLARLRLKARRHRVWFTKLSLYQRRFLDLVIRAVRKVRSFVLARALAPIVKRLLETIGNTEDLMRCVLGRVAWQMRYKAVKIAETLARISQSWGNRSATTWPKDKGFIRYLAVISLPENNITINL